MQKKIIISVSPRYQSTLQIRILQDKFLLTVTQVQSTSVNSTLSGPTKLIELFGGAN